MNDSEKVLGENMAGIVVYKGETIAVIGSGEIVPDAIGHIVFKAEGDDIAHVVFAPLDVGVADGTKLAEPDECVRMFCRELECGGITVA